MDKILITITTPVTDQEDQTPTPTKFLKQCEDIGLFNDLQKVNPFDETFRKAIDAQYPLLKYPLTVQSSEDTLNTPTPFQIVGIDGSKAEPLPLLFEKESLNKPNNPVVKKSTIQRSPIIQSTLDNDDSNDSVLNHMIEMKKKKERSSLDVNKTKMLPEPTRVISTSESIKKFILTKKKANKTGTPVDIPGTPVDDNDTHEHILKRLAKDTNQNFMKNINSTPIDWSSYLHSAKTDNEGFDSMVERLEALNSIKGLQTNGFKTVALLPKTISSEPELEITPIPSPSSLDKIPLPRKPSPVIEPPPVRKKIREISEEEKRQQILERNRLAAKRSRERQKIQQHALELRLREKEKENKQLKLEIRNLKLKLLAKEQDIDQLAHMKAQEMLSRVLGNT